MTDPFAAAIKAIDQALVKVKIDNPCPICQLEAAKRVLEAAGNDPLRLDELLKEIFKARGIEYELFPKEFAYLDNIILPDPEATTIEQGKLKESPPTKRKNDRSATEISREEE
jgi:hypothetical protein